MDDKTFRVQFPSGVVACKWCGPSFAKLVRCITENAVNPDTSTFTLHTGPDRNIVSDDAGLRNAAGNVLWLHVKALPPLSVVFARITGKRFVLQTIARSAKLWDIAFGPQSKIVPSSTNSVRFIITGHSVATIHRYKQGAETIGTLNTACIVHTGGNLTTINCVHLLGFL